MSIKDRHETWNGSPVPYGTSVEELRERILRRDSARWAALVALAHAPGEAALECLRELAGSPEPEVRRFAVQVIGSREDGGRLLDVLLERLQDPREYVVRTACEAVSELGLAEAHDKVIALLHAGLQTRITAVQALANLWRPEDFDGVFGLHRTDKSPEFRKMAAFTLRRFADEGNWAKLWDAWNEDPLPRHRVWACRLGEAYGDQAVLPRLRILREELDGHVRKAADEAIRRIEA